MLSRLSAAECSCRRIASVAAGSHANAVLGTRPEDIQITAPADGDFAAPVYICELTGDAVLVTVDVGGVHICARGERHLRFGFGDRIGMKINRDHCFLFDGKTERRIVRA